MGYTFMVIFLLEQAGMPGLKAFDLSKYSDGKTGNLDFGLY